MLKKLSVIFALVFVFSFMHCTAAVSAATVTLNQIQMASYFSSKTFDNLALDFTITPTQSDTLNALVVRNEGTARDTYEISKLVLWADAAPAGFDGFYGDTKIAESKFNATDYSWYFDNLNYNIANGGQKFFITVEVWTGGTSNRTYQLSIPAYSDINADGLFDYGESGIFMTSEVEVPTEKLINLTQASYYSTTADSAAPLCLISNLATTQTITETSYLIEGQAKDQGGSTPQWIKVVIDNQQYDATVIDSDSAGVYNWQYQWNDIANGAHTLKCEARDWVGNLGYGKYTYNITRNEATPEVPVTPEIDFTKSTFSNDRDEVTADGRDFVILGYEALDSNSDPVAGATVEIKTEQTWPIFDKKSGVTDADGKIYFIVKSTTAGEAVFVPWVNGEARPSSATVDFVSQPTPGNFDFSQGQLVKSPSRSSVYFIDNTNTKHVFPTQKVYASYFGNDFSAVKVWSDTELQEYALGSNVTFKEGTLFKIPEVSKVYKVEKFDNMRWIEDEPTAKALYGETWASLVYDLSEIFIDDYTEVESIKL